MKLQRYIILKVSLCSLVVLSMQNYVTGKGCLMSFRFFFFYSQIKHFPVSLRLFKIYVVGQRPQTIISLFPKQQILDSSKLKEFGDNNFKFNENDKQFSKWVENNVGKGEIAHYEQFLLFPLCFQKTCTSDT